MLIAVDFDGVIVQSAPGAWDPKDPLVLIPGAQDALRALKDAGHLIFIYSARANRSLRKSAKLDPLVRAGLAKKPSREDRKSNRQRYRQMKDFIRKNLGGCYDAIDDGRQGKSLADVFIDDKGMGFGPTATLAGDWLTVQNTVAMLAARKVDKSAKADLGALVVTMRPSIHASFGVVDGVPARGTPARVIHDLQTTPQAKAQ